jgi:hypothetical protein
MTGCLIKTEGVSVVVVEGGPKAQKRYSKVLLQRIDWGAVAEDAEDGPSAALGLAAVSSMCTIPGPINSTAFLFPCALFLARLLCNGGPVSTVSGVCRVRSRQQQRACLQAGMDWQRQGQGL